MHTVVYIQLNTYSGIHTLRYTLQYTSTVDINTNDFFPSLSPPNIPV